MTKLSWDVWSANVYLLLITKYNFTKEKAEDILYGHWTDCAYDMWKEGYSYEDTMKSILNENAPWNEESGTFTIESSGDRLCLKRVLNSISISIETNGWPSFILDAVDLECLIKYLNAQQLKIEESHKAGEITDEMREQWEKEHQPDYNPQTPSDKVLEDDIAEYIDKWRNSHSMTVHRIARHIINIIKENGNTNI
jgi:hypothetical protein